MTEEIQPLDLNHAEEALRQITYWTLEDSGADRNNISEMWGRIYEEGPEAEDPRVRLLVANTRLQFAAWGSDRGDAEYDRRHRIKVASEIDPEIFNEVMESYPEYGAVVQQSQERYEWMTRLAA